MKNPGKSFFKLPKCKNKPSVIKAIIYAVMKFVTQFVWSYLKGFILWMQADRSMVPVCRNCVFSRSGSKEPILTPAVALTHKAGGQMHAKFCLGSIRSNKCGKAE